MRETFLPGCINLKVLAVVLKPPREGERLPPVPGPEHRPTQRMTSTDQNVKSLSLPGLLLVLHTPKAMPLPQGMTSRSIHHFLNLKKKDKCWRLQLLVPPPDMCDNRSGLPASNAVHEKNASLHARSSVICQVSMAILFKVKRLQGKPERITANVCNLKGLTKCRKGPPVFFFLQITCYDTISDLQQHLQQFVSNHACRVSSLAPTPSDLLEFQQG